MSKISIVVPVYYNSDTLMLLYEDMKAKILEQLGDYELVFVDDGSGDNSWEIMNQIREMDANVQCVKLSRNFGEHAALLAGLNVCTGDCAVTKQADLQEDSEIILEMYESWKKGNKVVLAVREERDENPVKVFLPICTTPLCAKPSTKICPRAAATATFSTGRSSAYCSF
ncbi:MAG: glycosyltransferase family 2 protein [Lachnospiraceae bacterium]|nr:glycosyltransferase family 2 protein [Lachnospiraceae bacterium]